MKRMNVGTQQGLSFWRHKEVDMPPISLKRARWLLKRMLWRVRGLNRFTRVLYGKPIIRSVSVFGSTMRGEPMVGDVDVFIEMTPWFYNHIYPGCDSAFSHKARDWEHVVGNSKYVHASTEHTIGGLDIPMQKIYQAKTVHLNDTDGDNCWAMEGANAYCIRHDGRL